jgi:alkaline phosphatase
MKMSKITAVFLLTICTSFGGLNAGLAQQARDNGLHRLPKYVFFFLGDGMAAPISSLRKLT